MQKASPPLLQPAMIALILTAPLLVVLTLMQWAGPFSWDDGAITLAFGKTLMEHGRFALTPVSPVVEGSSSLLYTVLTGITQSLGQLDFDAAVTASRVISGLFASAAALLLLFALRPALGHRQAQIVALLFVLLPLNYNEIFNGMEMLSFGFLLLAWAVLIREGHDRGALLLLPLLLLCRFEASFYLGFALVGAWVFCRDGGLRRRLLTQFLVLCAAFLVISAGRYAVFGEFFPNTILAKMHAPYSYSGTIELYRKLAGLQEYLSFYFLPLGFAFYALWRNSALRGRVEPWLLLAFGIFAGLSGKNWGYDGRMVLAALPFTLLFLADAYSSVATRAAPGKPGAIIPLTVTLLAFTLTSVSSVRSLARELQTGMAYEALRLADQANTDPALPFSQGQYGVTPENYRITGLAVTELADRLGLATIRFAVPDVGGLGLCCERIDILDTALLTNPDLARKGYGYFGEQLASLRPDVIEAHEAWAELPGIYELPVFKSDYAPVIFRNNLLHLRRDHLEQLQSHGSVQPVSPARVDFDKVRYAAVPRDQDWLNAQPVIYLISPEADH